MRWAFGMKRIGKRQYTYLSAITDCTLSPLNKPIATVRPGEAVQIETFDCFGDTIQPGRDLAEALREGVEMFHNVATGPVYIEGAEAGDTLLVEILEFELPSLGVTTTVPGFGALEGWLTETPALTRFSEIHDGKATFRLDDSRTVKIDIHPFIGTIGVVPASESIPTTTPGKHGGNIDVPDVCKGNTLKLPIAVKGALFSLGDVHAAQGDGEICGTAVEVPAVVTVRFGLEKGRKIEWPRIESLDEIMTVCSAKPLEDAARLAFREMIRWLETDYGVNQYDAYMLLSLTATARIAQIVDPLYTVVVKLQKKYLRQLRQETA